MGKLKTSILDFLINKITTKTQSWKHTLLPQARQETSIMFLLLSLVIAMAIIKFPKKFFNQLNSLFLNLWWVGK